MSPARRAAYQIALQFEYKRTRLDLLFAQEDYLKNADGRDRRFVRHLISGSVRHLRYLDWLAAQLYHGPFAKIEIKLRVILRLALYEIIYFDSVPEAVSVNEYVTLTKNRMNFRASGLVNGVLRNFLRGKEQWLSVEKIKKPLKRIGTQYSFPDWLVANWLETFGEQDTEKLCAALNQPPRFDLQINQAQISVEKFISMLQKESLAFSISPYFSGMISVSDMQTIIARGWLDQGLCSVQDESAAIPVQCLDIQKDDRVLDVCAAPGGKFQQILQAWPSLAVAVDSDLSRLKRVKQNLQRLKLTSGYMVCADARQLPFKTCFSKILVDAPCSGLGVIRKHPDIKWRRTELEIETFAHLQKQILENAAEYLSEKGRIAYSTCTIERQENQAVTAAFLQHKTEQFEALLPPKSLAPFIEAGQIHTLPQLHQMDGSFCALFQKK